MIPSSTILAGALELLAPAGAWCQRAAARTIEGLAVGPTSPQACSYCIAGAIERACAPKGHSLTSMDPALGWVRAMIGRRDSGVTAKSLGAIANWQDVEDRTKREVHDLVEEARVAALEAGD